VRAMNNSNFTGRVHSPLTMCPDPAAGDFPPAHVHAIRVSIA
jgi:hypothetical protein